MFFPGIRVSGFSLRLPPIMVFFTVVPLLWQAGGNAPKPPAASFGSLAPGILQGEIGQGNSAVFRLPGGRPLRVVIQPEGIALEVIVRDASGGELFRESNEDDGGRPVLVWLFPPSPSSLELKINDSAPVRSGASG